MIDAISAKERLRRLSPNRWEHRWALCFIAAAIVLALMCEARASDMPPFKLDHPEVGVNYVALVPSSRCSCIAFGGSALQSAENRFSAIRSARSLHCPLDGLPQGIMGEFVPIRAVCETRMGRGLGEQPIQNGGRRTRFGVDLGSRWDYSLHLAAAPARDSQFRRSGARKTCDSSWQNNLRVLLSDGGVQARRLHEGRFMGVADAAERNAPSPATPSIILSHPICPGGFTIAQRYDTRNAAGTIIKSVWVRKCTKGRIVYGRKV